jgi:hypothetical protein
MVRRAVQKAARRPPSTPRLSRFAEFEREFLRERTRADLAYPRQNGKRLGRPATSVAHRAEIEKLYRAGVSKSETARRLQIGRTVRRVLGARAMRKSRKDPIREDRIHNEAIVDAGPEEQALSWHYYLEFLSGETTFAAVLVRWQGKKMAVPLCQFTAVDQDQSTAGHGPCSYGSHLRFPVHGGGLTCWTVEGACSLPALCAVDNSS